MKGITRTELVWVGKYDDEGNLRPVERTILPFQVVDFGYAGSLAESIKR
jgi:hypothetical protein